MDGHDRAGDNLAVYDDGSYCFRCGYITGSGDVRKRVLKAQGSIKNSEGISNPSPNLPNDCRASMPVQAKEWLSNFSLGLATIVKENILWSDYYQRIIFPIKVDSTLLGWQGRYIKLNESDPDRPKWYTKGNIKQLPLIFKTKGDNKTITLVEDIISFIKLKVFGMDVYCLFGSNVTREVLVTCKLHDYNHIHLWLDSDKIDYCKHKAKQIKDYGFKCTYTHSIRDPKEHTNNEIKEIDDQINR